MKSVAVLYLDLDGTVRQGVDDPLGRFVNTADDVFVFPEAVTMMQRWRANGGRIVGITNQGGVALGHLTHDQMVDNLRETQRQTGGLFNKILACTHHPNHPVPEMAVCWCRKPRIGLIVEAAVDMARESYDHECYPPHLALMVGDLPTDEETAAAAGISFMWAAEWRDLARKEQTL